MAKSKDFLFATEHTKFYFPWICFIMVFIATLLTGFGLFVHNGLNSWRQGISESLTIQINTYDAEGKYRGDLIPVDIEKSLSIVRTTPGVKGASIVSDEQMAQLMAPWIGSDVGIETLPLPKLIDVAIDPHNPPSLEQLKKDLTNQVPEATLDSHRIWLENLITASNRIIQIIGIVLILLIFTIICTVAYTTRATLSIHESVLQLVHMMGATDWYITRKFGLHNLKRALGSSMVGFFCAIPVLLMISLCCENFSDSAVQTNLSHLQWLYLILIPIGLAGICLITTIKTVRQYLKRFL